MRTIKICTGSNIRDIDYTGVSSRRIRMTALLYTPHLQSGRYVRRTQCCADHHNGTPRRTVVHGWTLVRPAGHQHAVESGLAPCWWSWRTLDEPGTGDGAAWMADRRLLATEECVEWTEHCLNISSSMTHMRLMTWRLASLSRHHYVIVHQRRSVAPHAYSDIGTSTGRRPL